jgi:cysteinyl-tRNA synthetase
MDDDFTTADAVAVIFELVREINSTLAASHNPTRALAQGALAIFRELTDVLGLLYSEEQSGGMEKEVEALIEARQAARKEKNWAEADRIRDRLKDRALFWKTRLRASNGEKA